MTIGKKLIPSVAALFAVVLGVTFSSLYSLGMVGSELNKSSGPYAQRIALVGELKATANIMRTGQRGMLLNTIQKDAKGVETTLRDYDARSRKAEALMLELRRLLTSEKEKAFAESLHAAIRQHVSAFQKITTLCAASRTDEASALYRKEGAPAGSAMEKIAAEFMDVEKEFMKESAAIGARKLAEARWIAVFMNVLALIVVGVIIYFVRGIINDLRKVATELAEGARQMAGAAGQVASASQSLAQGASEEAASIEETSASSEEVASMIRKNAENSKTAGEVMSTVDARIAEGNHALDEMVSSMQEITSSSDKISKIIKVIDEIAFQTNILALNAAVEAARAGDAGMGFSVVADEVRNLAQRSAQAARDTATLIGDSILKSNEGSARLQRVTDIIRSITNSGGKVKMLVDEVSQGSSEQARGMDEISKAIGRLEHIAQNTAASAEESASASEQLSAQAQTMHQIADGLQAMTGRKA